MEVGIGLEMHAVCAPMLSVIECSAYLGALHTPPPAWHRNGRILLARTLLDTEHTYTICSYLSLIAIVIPKYGCRCNDALEPHPVVVGQG